MNICEKLMPGGVDPMGKAPTRSIVEHFRYYFSGICLSCIIWCGIVGNLGIIILFLKKNVWARVNYYLITIAIWDIMLLSCTWPIFSLSVILFHGIFPTKGNWAVANSIFYALINCAMTGCIWTTLTLTFERFAAIHNPLGHKRYLTPMRDKIILVCVSCAAVLFAIPRYFEAAIITCPVAPTGYILIVVPSPLLFDRVYFTAYRVVGGLICITVLPFLLMTVLTLKIIFALRKAYDQNRNHNVRFNVRASSNTGLPSQPPNIRRSKSLQEDVKFCKHSGIRKTKNGIKAKPNLSRRPRRAESALNKIFVLVLLKFLACYTLPTLIDILERILGNRFRGMILIYLVEISNFLVVCHSASNFVLHFIYGPKLMRELKKVINQLCLNPLDEPLDLTPTYIPPPVAAANGAVSSIALLQARNTNCAVTSSVLHAGPHGTFSKLKLSIS